MKTVLAIDVGSTTTKAVLFQQQGSRFGLVDWAGAPTTVEKPFENVLIGVKHAIVALQQKTEIKILENGNFPTKGDTIDALAVTSSAGGGLQMLVAGLMTKMTAESAEKAALGAGAIVMDVLAIDDERSDLEKINRICQLNPDMVLLSGGVDGGNTEYAVSLAEIVALASREIGSARAHRLPVVYAGNKDARQEVETILSGAPALEVSYVENIRPAMDREVLEPASAEIRRLFLEHVMSKAPGYEELVKISEGRVKATPAAVSELISRVGSRTKQNLMAIDIGGATTDVFSSVSTGMHQIEHRTVDANLGMSYSIGNVLAEVGSRNIRRWLPFSITDTELRDVLSNKMVYPTILPITPKALLIEHAVAREAIRMSVRNHMTVTRGLRGVQVERYIGSAFDQSNPNEIPLVNGAGIDMVIGSGGVLSHAPVRNQALLVLLDAVQPEGVTKFCVDSIFMMPHLGMIATINESLALEAFTNDCLVNLGTVIAPTGPYRLGEIMAHVMIDFDDGTRKTEKIVCGELSNLQLQDTVSVSLTVEPCPGYDCGAGKNTTASYTVSGGTGGIIFDGRGRPIVMADDNVERVNQLTKWIKNLEVYSESFLKEAQICR